VSAAATDALLARALELGWAAAGVASVAPFEDAARQGHAAISEGRLAGMPWLSHERVDAAADLRGRYPWARALLSLAWAYPRAPAPPEDVQGRPRGRVASYVMVRGADGAAVDYHELLKARADELCDEIARTWPGARSKGFVDHGWAMDKPIAERAGLGFVGKNTTLITEAPGPTSCWRRS
jgi:epoxyqueuosine reductase